jgi:hypothetical protein
MIHWDWIATGVIFAIVLVVLYEVADRLTDLYFVWQNKRAIAREAKANVEHDARWRRGSNR